MVTKTRFYGVPQNTVQRCLAQLVRAVDYTQPVGGSSPPAPTAGW